MMANPPFMTPRGGIRPHKRFSVQANRSEVLFVAYIMEHLNNKGRAGIIVPEGIIFQSSNAYKQLRKMLVEDGLWSVASLPQGAFNPYAGVKTSILFFDNTIVRQTKEILFVKVENDGFDLGAQRRPIDKNDLPKALAVLEKYRKTVQGGKKFNLGKDEKVFSSIVKKDKIAENGDYNLSADRYLAAIDYTNVKWPMIRLGEFIGFLQKSDRRAGDGIPTGKYPFFTSGQNQDKWLDAVDYREEALILGTGGSASVHISISFSTSADVFVIKSNSEKLNNKFLYYFLKNNINILNAGFRGVGLKHLSREYLKQIQIPLPLIEVQKEIVAELDGYQKIIDGAKQIVDNYKPTIKIDPKWEKIKLGSEIKINNGYVLTEFNDDGKVACIKVSDMNLSENQNEIRTASHWIRSTKKELLPIDSIIFPKRGAAIATNKKRITKIPCLIDNNCMGITVLDNNKLYPLYLYTYLLGFDLTTISNSAGIALINNGDISNVLIPLPSLETQKKIVEKIEEEQKIIEANKKLIDLFEQKIKDKISELWGE